MRCPPRDVGGREEGISHCRRAGLLPGTLLRSENVCAFASAGTARGPNHSTLMGTVIGAAGRALGEGLVETGGHHEHQSQKEEQSRDQTQ